MRFAPDLVGTCATVCGRGKSVSGCDVVAVKRGGYVVPQGSLAGCLGAHLDGWLHGVGRLWLSIKRERAIYVLGEF